MKKLLSIPLCLFIYNALAQESPQQWYDDGQSTVERNHQQALQALEHYQRKAKNVVLFIGDGMGISTVTAARILEGQLLGKSGEENQLAFEKLQHMALSKTYNTNQQTSDSAGTMSAIITGVKTKAGVISINQNTLRGDCGSAKGHEVETFLELAEKRGLSTGIISTARLTHATPAATYAHVPERNWESDADMPKEAREQGCKDIASQLIDFSYGDGIDVAMGGGRRAFLPRTTPDPENDNKSGKRKDGRNLTKEWIQKGAQHYYIWDKKGFDSLPKHANTKVLGLFNRSHMQYEVDRKDDRAGEPSLAEMANTALDILQLNPKGYFLMIEGGRIDHGHHAGNAFRALTDTIAFSDAVQTVLDKVDLRDTLVIVTADHSHVFTIAGYPTRGNPILGKVISNNASGEANQDWAKDALGLPYTTLNYANGPGYTGASNAQAAGHKRYPHRAKQFKQLPQKRPNLTEVNTQSNRYMQESIFPTASETHGGEDVAIYASGPMAHTLNGVIEQNVIYHVMKAAIEKNR